MTELAFPYGIDGRGRTADAGRDEHIRELIEQLLLTAPGERVNRPSFGAGLLRLIQEGMISGLSAATQTLVLGSLQATLGELIDVSAVGVEATDTELQITLSYTVKATGRSEIATVTQELI